MLAPPPDDSFAGGRCLVHSRSGVGVLLDAEGVSDFRGLSAVVFWDLSFPFWKTTPYTLEESKPQLGVPLKSHCRAAGLRGDAGTQLNFSGLTWTLAF